MKKIKIIVYSAIILLGALAPMAITNNAMAADGYGQTECIRDGGYWFHVSVKGSSSPYGFYCEHNLNSEAKCKAAGGNWVGTQGGNRCDSPRSPSAVNNNKSVCEQSGGNWAGNRCIMPQTGIQNPKNEQCPSTYFNWGDGCVGIPGLIMTIFNWLTIGVAAAIVIGIILGAIQYSTAQGNQENAKKGIQKITSALLALGLYLIMWALLNFLVPGGMLNDQGEPTGVSKVKDSHYAG